MKILHINTHDRGGAANACLRLHEGLLNFGVDSKVLVLQKTNSNFSEVYAHEQFLKKTLPARLRRRLQRILKECGLYRGQNFRMERDTLQKLRPKGLEMISFPKSESDVTDNKFFREADIIHLHWVAGFLDYKTFFTKCQKSVIWTFHDQNPFLGVEHYAERLLGPDDSGQPIPRRFNNNKELKIEERFKQQKRNLFKNTSLNIVALCNWMKNEIIDSQMFPLAKMNIIPNGIDSKQYKILNKTFCRELLNLPIEKKILLFASDSISKNRKGLNYLLKAHEEIQGIDLVICGIGGDKTNSHNKNFIELGMIHDQQLMNAAYSAADLFVIPSLMDNLPNTVIESLLSGTPVVSFPVGGMLDMIQHKKNGCIANEISVKALANSIVDFFEIGVELSTEEIRKDAIERYDVSVQLDNILQLYKDTNAVKNHYE